MLRFLILIVCFALFGCQTSKAHLPDYKDTVEMTVISFPPGAIIEVDGAYLGRTPNIVALKEYFIDRTRYAPYYRFSIYPPQDDGYCTKKMAVDPYNLPDTLKFDLTDCQVETAWPNVAPNGQTGGLPDTPTY